jgi:Arc/MetJ family transcription regulator
LGLIAYILNKSSGAIFSVSFARFGIAHVIAKELARRSIGLAMSPWPWHYLHMKRTNLVLREDLLEEATRLSGEKTYSRVVERALEDFVRRMKARQILELRGSGLWEGDLAEMRRDQAPARRKAR